MIDSIERLAHGVERLCWGDGLTLVARCDRHRPLAEVRCYVRGGSIAEWPDGGSGAAHLVEHVVATRAVREMEERGIGVLLNAATARDHTAIRWNVLAADCAPSLRAFFTACRRGDGWRREIREQRRVILEELDALVAGPRRLRQRFLEELFARHPARYPVGGYPERLRELDSEAVDAYHRRLYGGGNLCVVVVGDFDFDEVAAALEDSGARLPGTPFYRLPDEASEPDGPRPRSFALDGDDRTAEYTEVGFRTVGIEAPEALLFEVLAVEINTHDGGGLAGALSTDGGATPVVARSIATAFGAGFFSLLVRHAAGAGEAVAERAKAWLRGLAAGEHRLDLGWTRAEASIPAGGGRLADWARSLGEAEIRQRDPLAEERRRGRLAGVTVEEIAAAVGLLGGEERVLCGHLRRQ